MFQCSLPWEEGELYQMEAQNDQGMSAKPLKTGRNQGNLFNCLTENQNKEGSRNSANNVNNQILGVISYNIKSPLVYIHAKQPQKQG